MSDALDALCRAIAWRFPRRLVYWAGMRILAEATSGRRPRHRYPDSVKLFPELDRWIPK